MPTAKGRLLRAAAIVLTCMTGASLAGDDPPKADKLDKAEGVIVKVEDTRDHLKLTINTAAVWSDYVRDQASAKGKSKDGENSIAAKGEPKSPTTTIVVEVGESTRLANRFRSTTDETSKGSKTAADAKTKDGGDDEKKASDDEKEAPPLKAKDLKRGQFVQVEARKGRADRLFVLKPIGGAQTPAPAAVAPK